MYWYCFLKKHWVQQLCHFLVGFSLLGVALSVNDVTRVIIVIIGLVYSCLYFGLGLSLHCWINEHCKKVQPQSS